MASPALWLGLVYLVAAALSGCVPPVAPDIGGPDDDIDLISEPDPDGDTLDACAGPQPLPLGAPLRLMTRLEYDNTVRDLLGDTTHPARELPPENEALGFSNGEAHTASPLLVELFMRASEDVARRAVEEQLDTLLPCDPDSVDETTCGPAFVQAFVSRAFRRPVVYEEFAVFNELYLAARSQWSFEESLQMVIQAVLQSPQFLYRLELVPIVGEGPFAHPQDDDALVPLEPYALASRLSYFLWNSMPDDALLVAAADGELSTRAGLEVQARRMLEDERARGMIADFTRQWLGLDRLDGASKDSVRFPGYSPAVSASWKRGVEAFVENVVLDSEGTIEELFTSETGFMNPTLAAFYDVDGPAEDHTYAPVAFPHGERAGLITQPGVLALLAGADQGSPIRRGIFVREKLLCEPLPPPPNDLVVVPPDPDPNATTRERFAEHTSQETCQSCHILIDPVGFGFENYDAVGRYREEENGMPVDASGELLYTYSGDPNLEGPFVGAVELGARLAKSPQVERCMLTQWFRYAFGRKETAADQCSLDDIEARFRSSGGNLRELLVAIALSDSFRMQRVYAGGEP